MVRYLGDSGVSARRARFVARCRLHGLLTGVCVSVSSNAKYSFVFLWFYPKLIPFNGAVAAGAAVRTTACSLLGLNQAGICKITALDTLLSLLLRLRTTMPGDEMTVVPARAPLRSPTSYLRIGPDRAQHRIASTNQHPGIRVCQAVPRRTWHSGRARVECVILIKKRGHFIGACK